ncbi:uncharacterized protein DNG_09379 [Cephalotrichum gorgonifer]|uniref:Subtilisin-like serine protease n=1 Tax=Cephalotrichum gorgonifer TaxID=2041049 RepID=A0AAE8N849_9PEZI|nr:uncharacterized protein DNG_09379 [Cephalotrichum gorgonifer]
MDSNSFLPASCRTSDDDLADPSWDIPSFLSRELDLSRLSRIQKSLWLAGRPMPPRPLHHQLVLGRTIVVTERMDMHLVWKNDRIFLKPLPGYLILDATFWPKYLACTDECAVSKRAAVGAAADSSGLLPACDRTRIRKSAMGLLFSYAALIMHESDFEIAKDRRLIPADLPWLKWREIVSRILHSPSSWGGTAGAVHLDEGVAGSQEPPSGERNIRSSTSEFLVQDTAIYQFVDPRFHYGELRLSRLNKIYRYTRVSGGLRGYMWGWNTYSSFFSDNFTLLASTTVYFALVLTAMQVGLGTTSLMDNETFQNASAGFTIFSIVGPLAAAGLIALMFVYLLIGNLLVAVRYKKRRFKHMEGSRTMGE